MSTTSTPSTGTQHPDVLAGLAEVLAEVADTPVEAVVPEATFEEDLDVDSLAMVEVVMAVEERFSVRIPDEALEQIRTVGDAVAHIAATRGGSA